MILHSALNDQGAKRMYPGIGRQSGRHTIWGVESGCATVDKGEMKAGQEGGAVYMAGRGHVQRKEAMEEEEICLRVAEEERT